MLHYVTSTFQSRTGSFNFAKKASSRRIHGHSVSSRVGDGPSDLVVNSEKSWTCLRMSWDFPWICHGILGSSMDFPWDFGILPWDFPIHDEKIHGNHDDLLWI